MDSYNLNIRDVVKYCRGKNEIIHIDGTHSAATVNTNICARIMKNQIQLVDEN